MKWLLLIFGCLLAFNAKAAVVSKADFVNAVKKEFTEQNIAEDADIEIFGGKVNFEYNDADKTEIMLSALDVEPQGNRFSVIAEIFADGELQDKTKIIGRYFAMREVWVPMRDIKKDSIIKEDDLQKIRVRSNRLRDASVWLKEDIIEKQAAHSLKSGKVLEKDDLQAVAVIKKGQTVMAIYTKKGLQITSKMQALEAGAIGDMIKLLNSSSKKEITGVVKDANSVEIIGE